MQDQDDYEYIVRALGEDNQAFAGKTVLLLGSQGFLGRLFQQYFDHLNRLVFGETPVRVICIDIPAVAEMTPQYANMDYWKCDISGAVPWLSSALQDREIRIDYVLNLSGRASPKAYSEAPLETIRVSVQGTENMLRLARDLKVTAYLGCSSSEIYGNPPPESIPTPEDYLGGVETNCERGCYDISKLQLENLCYIYRTRYGVNTQVIRPFNVIGYTGNDGRVLPNSVARLLRGEKLKVFLPGTQTRTFCWFSDFLIGAVKVLLHGDGKPTNLGNSDNEISMVDLMHKLESIAGKTGQVELIEPSEVYKTEPMRRCPDITRARQLGYEPKVSLDEALMRFWSWAKEEYPKV